MRSRRSREVSRGAPIGNFFFCPLGDDFAAIGSDAEKKATLRGFENDRVWEKEGDMTERYGLYDSFPPFFL